MTRLVMCGAIAAGYFAIAQAIAADSGDAKVNEQRTISLSEIVATSRQNGLQSVQDVLQQQGNAKKPVPTDAYLRQILSGSNGSSNVFLVDATTVFDALEASSSILVGSLSADTPAPVNTSNPKRGSHWLVAYLGTGPSNPTWWTIESVSVDKSKVVLRYRKSKPKPGTEDAHRYYYWIPLGKLAPGAYEIQLFDAEQATVTLMRRVEVAL